MHITSIQILHLKIMPENNTKIYLAKVHLNLFSTIHYMTAVIMCPF
jgi:hypothetical protein